MFQQIQNRPFHSATAGALLAATLVCASQACAQDTTVPFYHATADHAGLFVVPGLTAQTVAATKPDDAFDGSVPGVLNAAPLYWHPAGATRGYVVVSTDSNIVAALDEVTGKPVWQTTLGTPGSRGSECGNINPTGVTGTPVIDAASGTLYLDAVIGGSGTGVHEVFGLSMATGAVLPGWPVAIGPGLSTLGQSFDDTLEEQRGALALVKGRVYVPFGGYIGDCGSYHGMVVGVNTAKHVVSDVWATTALKGGIWAPGGVVADASSLYFATGNTTGATTWGGGEAVLHAQPSLGPITNPKNYFTPSNWSQLDSEDYDLGGTSPTLIDLPSATPRHLAMALGKDGNAYLLNRTALGGIGTALQTLHVSDKTIHSSTARYTLNGTAMVVVNAHDPSCASSPNDLIALRVTAGSPPTVTHAWCALLNGRGDPIVTTSDGVHNPIVWVAGAEGDETLHAFAGDDGRALFTASSASASTIAHFSTLLVANGRLFVPSQNRLLAFTLGH